MFACAQWGMCIFPENLKQYHLIEGSRGKTANVDREKETERKTLRRLKEKVTVVISKSLQMSSQLLN